jgi:hypothetical protein
MKNKTVILNISRQISIETVKNEFNRTFPFLKIEFFKKPHKKGGSSTRTSMYSNNEKIGLIGKVNTLTRFPVSNNMTVNEFEKGFEKNYNLYVQVFRKSGDVWLETSATDDWTLEEQNAEGKNLSEQLKIEKTNFEDHDIW